MFRANPYTFASTLSLKIGGLVYFSPFPNSQNRFDVCLFKVFLGAQLKDCLINCVMAETSLTQPKELFKRKRFELCISGFSHAFWTSLVGILTYMNSGLIFDGNLM